MPQPNNWSEMTPDQKCDALRTALLALSEDVKELTRQHQGLERRAIEQALDTAARLDRLEAQLTPPQSEG